MSNGSAKSSLPSGWVQTTVREVFTVVGGGTPSTSVADYWNGGIPWITSADIGGIREIMPRKTISEDGVRHSATNVVPAHAIIVVTRVGLGKVGLTDRPLAFSQDCQGLISNPTLVDPGFAAYQLLERVQTFKYESRGTTISGVTKKQLLDLPFHLAPYAEQRRIVGAIEEQFSRIDAGVEALQRARRNLKRIRAAVLQAAVTGRLVPQEPGDEPGEIVLKRTLAARRETLARTGRGYFEPAAPNLDGAPDLPTGWTWASLDALAEIVGGVTKDAKRELAPSLVEVPYLRVANVQRGYLDLRDIATIRVPPERVGELRLLPGDILFTEGGDRDKLGRGWIWEGQIDPCIHQNHIFRARLYSTQVDPRFVSLHGNTFGQAWFVTAGKQTTNLASVSLNKLKQLPVPVPPPGEQRRIVSEVERQTSFIENLSRVVEMSLQRGGVLRSSVLQAAFAGRLVARDTSEEPASSLLERIGGDRVAGDFKRQRLLRRSRR